MTDTGTPLLHIHYCDSDTNQLANAALGVIGFGEQSIPTGASPLFIHTGLRSLHAGIRSEILGAHGAVRTGGSSHIRFASDTNHLLAQLQIAESDFASLEEAAASAYRELCEFNSCSGYPHVLRMWNYMDDINAGEGDDERYKQFCTGRARGFGDMRADQYPAASAIGRQLCGGTLLIYWLAARVPGLRLENPRQVSAYRYPRTYGPVAPSFARACLLSDGLLMISGTASIMGHTSCHPQDVRAQLQETLNNVDALIAHARAQSLRTERPVPAQLGPHSLLKVYVRHAEHAPLIHRELEQRCGADVPMVLLGADICRRELLLEIDCVHGLVSQSATRPVAANFAS